MVSDELDRARTERLDRPLAERRGYRCFAPRRELAPFVRCLWTLVDDGSAGVGDTVVPDGCSEVVVNRADPFVADGNRQGEVSVVGQLTGALELVPTGVVDLVGVRFEPAGLHAFLGGRRADELTGVDEPLEGRLAAELRAARTIGAVEQALLRALRPTSAVTRAAVQWIRASDGNLAIGSLGERLAVHPRTLERAFAAEVGLSAKALARIVRFRSVIDRLDPFAPEPWSAVALRAGYSDQAHLTREFRRLAGTTPARWLARERGLGDHFVAVGSVGIVQSDAPHAT